MPTSPLILKWIRAHRYLLCMSSMKKLCIFSKINQVGIKVLFLIMTWVLNSVNMVKLIYNHNIINQFDLYNAVKSKKKRNYV